MKPGRGAQWTGIGLEYIVSVALLTLAARWIDKIAAENQDSEMSTGFNLRSTRVAGRWTNRAVSSVLPRN
jgi:hypothetical protein